MKSARGSNVAHPSASARTVRENSGVVAQHRRIFSLEATTTVLDNSASVGRIPPLPYINVQGSKTTSVESFPIAVAGLHWQGTVSAFLSQARGCAPKLKPGMASITHRDRGAWTPHFLSTGSSRRPLWSSLQGLGGSLGTGEADVLHATLREGLCRWVGVQRRAVPSAAPAMAKRQLTAPCRRLGSQCRSLTRRPGAASLVVGLRAAGNIVRSPGWLPGT